MNSRALLPCSILLSKVYLKILFSLSRNCLDYVINTLLYVLPGALVKVIASTAHFLVVERSYHDIVRWYCDRLRCKLTLDWQECFLQFTRLLQTCLFTLLLEHLDRDKFIPSVAYPLNDSRTITYYRFTMPYLRTWLTCRSFSLAHFRHYAVVDLTWSLSPRLSYVYLLDPSDGILEGTVPVKLPIRHVPSHWG